MRSIKVKDNLGLARRYVANIFLRFGRTDVIEDSYEYSWCCEGLMIAEREYDPMKLNPQTGKPFAFSSLAWKCMFTACSHGYRKKLRLDCLNPISISEEWQFGFSKDQNDDISNPIVEVLKKIELKDYLQKDFKMLLMYYLKNMTMQVIGKKFGVCKERVRQRMNRAKEYIAKKIDYEDLEEDVNMSYFRKEIQQWYENDFNEDFFNEDYYQSAV